MNHAYESVPRSSLAVIVMIIYQDEYCYCQARIVIGLLVTLTWHREAARNTIRERGHGRKTIPKRESSDEGSERERDVCE